MSSPLPSLSGCAGASNHKCIWWVTRVTLHTQQQHTLTLYFNNDAKITCMDTQKLQCHGYWWPGDLCRQGISSHVIDIFLPEYSKLSTKVQLHWSFWLSLYTQLRFFAYMYYAAHGHCIYHNSIHARDTTVTVQLINRSICAFITSPCTA